MKEAIRQEALSLGFDECRFAPATTPESSDHLGRWLDAGLHGEMEYLARNAWKRTDPQKVLPGARSMVCVAVNYGHPQLEGHISTDRRLVGKVARYAQHEDYHAILGQRLKRLTEFIQQQAGEGHRSLWYVDTGPILEREFAQRAGIGFIGKHTGLVSRRFGNWILLGEILTTIELEPDPPEKNRCGSCSRCQSACPTNAIRAPFELDTRLCISYLTIELKGSIPEALRPAVGNRILGCDDCLEVCPWNRFAAESRMLQQYRRDDLQSPNLLELLALDQADFKRRFRGTPMERTKRRGLLRNVCVALGNVGGEEALPALGRASNDDEPLIAEHAGWAIQQIETRAGQAAQQS